MSYIINTPSPRLVAEDGKRLNKMTFTVEPGSSTMDKVSIKRVPTALTQEELLNKYLSVIPCASIYDEELQNKLTTAVEEMITSMTPVEQTKSESLDLSFKTTQENTGAGGWFVSTSLADKFRASLKHKPPMVEKSTTTTPPEIELARWLSDVPKVRI